MYEAGFLDTRVTVLNREEHTETEYGRQGGDYVKTGEYWANWHFTKGAQAMREGALEAYDTIMVRMRWHAGINRDSRIEKAGKTYQIVSLNADKRRDEMQMVIVELQ